MKQISFRGPTNISRRLTKFSWPGDLVPGICAPLVYGIRLLCRFPYSTPGSIYEFPRDAVGTSESTPPFLHASLLLLNLFLSIIPESRKLHNEELNDLHSSPNIVRVIKSRIMKWAGHVARIEEGRGVYRVLVGKPEGKRPLGRPSRKW